MVANVGVVRVLSNAFRVACGDVATGSTIRTKNIPTNTSQNKTTDKYHTKEAQPIRPARTLEESERINTDSHFFTWIRDTLTR